MPDLGPTGYALIAYFVLLVGLTRLRGREVQSPLIQRLRAFFPAWRFFEEVGEVPHLLVRTGDDEARLGGWRAYRPRVRRRWGSLVLDPAAGLELAYGSLLEQLVSDLELLSEEVDAAALEDVVSYRLARNLVLACLAAAGAAGACYQFKLRSAPQGAPDDAGEDVLVSPVYRR